MGELLENVSKSFSSVLNFGQDSQRQIQDEGNPFAFLNFGQASQPNQNDDQNKQKGENLEVLVPDPKSRRQRQRDFQGDIGILKEALRKLVDRQKEAPVEATKLAKDHKSMAAIKGRQIKTLCEERAARLPTTIQRKHDTSKEDQAKISNTEGKETDRKQERQGLDMETEMQKRREEAGRLTKEGKEHEDNEAFHKAVAAYDRALRILLHGKIPQPAYEAPPAPSAASTSAQTSPVGTPIFRYRLRLARVRSPLARACLLARAQAARGLSARARARDCARLRGAASAAAAQ